MKLKNNALQEAYDTIVNSIAIISASGGAAIDKAFRECDKKLSESVTFEQLKNLQRRNDILERSNANLRGARAEAISKQRRLEKEIEGQHKIIDIMSTSEHELEKDLDAAKKQRDYFKRISDDLQSRAHHAEDEVEELKKRICQLEKDLDIWRRSNGALEKRILEKDLDDAKNQLDYYKHSYYDLVSRAKHAEKEVEDASKQIQNLKVFNSEITSKNVDIANENVKLARKNELLEAKILETTETLEKTNADRTELQKDRDKLFEEKRKLNARTDCLREEVKWYRKHYKEQYDKIRELNHRLLSIPVNATAFDQGQKDLWDMLQNVNDINVEEFDVECHSTNDVISMDLEDFLDCYKKWQEQKETDRMRKWLTDFCYERVCEGCPLESSEYKCGCGYSFRGTDPSDNRIVPDEDIKRYYEKARGCDHYTPKLTNGKLFVHDLSHPMESINRGITKACEDFCKAVRDADTKITESIKRGSWECTLEANVEVNKDLLEKVCGVKPEEEEHKLEYGDAVRLPWRDYDYMYIGPEGKHIRLFNPKTHNVACVSSTENLTYQGCKIVICDEDDLRKIWKDKK